MSHHSSNDEASRAMSEAMREVFGEFPAGKLNASDEGALVMAVGTENERVILRFPKPVAWVGFRPQEAADLASDLIKWARRVASETGQSLTVKLP